MSAQQQQPFGGRSPSLLHPSASIISWPNESVVSWGLKSIPAPYPRDGSAGTTYPNAAAASASATPAGRLNNHSTSLTASPSLDRYGMSGSASTTLPLTPPPPSTSFYDPDSWYKEYKQLNTTALKKSDYVVVSHHAKATLHSKTSIRAACCVRVLPNLDVVKAALRMPAHARRKQRYEMWESASAVGETERGAGDKAAKAYMPTPAIWTTGSVNDSDIIVYDAFSGRPLMRIAEPKPNVAATSLLHAPFRGFMDRQLKVLPIYKPKDMLRLRSSHVVDTDYVWVGFNDGSIRLLPANPARIREADRSEKMSRGQLADLVFELPKNHSGSIVSIARSPCHRDDEGTDLSTSNRLSTAFHYMTAAGSSDSDRNREHLSLMCTASVDSVIVVWDVRKIYQAMEAMRSQHREAAAGGYGSNNNNNSTSNSSSRMHGSGRAASASFANSGLLNSGEVVSITVDTPGGGGPFTVRSTCTLIKVRPLMKLKGGVAGLKTMQWTSCLVTTAGYEKHRKIDELTRDPEELSAPKIVKDQRKVQTLTRRDRREEYRRVLRLSEPDMQEVEDELQRLMPPLATEPEQSLRINLIVAGDSTGTVHIWNLDDELNRKMCDPLEFSPHSARNNNSSSRGASRRMHSESPGRSSVNSSMWNASVASPSVQMSAVEAPIAKKKKKTATSGAKSTTKSAAAPKTRPSTTPTTTGAAARASRLGTARSTAPSKSKARAESQQSSAKPRKTAVQQPAPLSRLQLLALHMENPNTPLREINTAMDVPRKASESAARRSPSMPTITSKPVASPRKSTSRAVAPSTAGKSTKSSKKPTANGREVSVANSTNRMSPSRASCGNTPNRRGFDSPARGEVISPRNNHRSPRNSSVSPSRAKSEKGAADAAGGGGFRLNDHLTRTSKCRIEFTGGVAINGMAVDVPSVLRTTLRRLPDPEGRSFSLLEDPTPEEVERRLLENSFEDLCEEKALFFVFQQLQIYVAVEGTVLNLRCLPQWDRPDEDGRLLFKLRRLDHGAMVSRQQLANEIDVGGQVIMPAFSVSLRKLILEAHSQPVTRLFLDQQRGNVWVGRNDGLLSIFSKMTKKMVTRVPHPCADVALGPPNQAGWLRQQNAYLRESNLSPNSLLHLEWHKETRGYEAAHFSDFVPFCRRTQTAVLLTATSAAALRSQVARIGHINNAYYPHYGLMDHAFSPVLSSSSLMIANKMDGRSDLSSNAKKREVSLVRFLEALKHCRAQADKVRRAEKGAYEVACNRVAGNVNYVLQEIGNYSLIPMLRGYFSLWKAHTHHYRYEHLMRRQRTRRRDRDRVVAMAAERAAQQRLLGAYFVHWSEHHVANVLSRKSRSLKGILGGMTSQLHDHTLPTAKMMEHLWAHRTRSSVLAAWQTWLAQRRAAKKRTTAARSPSPRRAPSPRQVINSNNRGASPMCRTNTATFHTPKQDADVSSPSPPQQQMQQQQQPSSQTEDECLVIADEEPFVTTFKTMMHMMQSARPFIMHFRDSVADSVIDMSWMSIVESAEGGADTDDEMGRRYAVFNYGLLPLLQGLLSTSEDVLPNLRDASVAEEVISMLTGIQLCVDYVTADSEDFLASLQQQQQEQENSSSVSEPNAAVWTVPSPSSGSSFMDIMSVYMTKALQDEEGCAAIKEVAEEKESLEVFLDFAEEDCMEVKRVRSVSWR